jgi:hypothetical protein
MLLPILRFFAVPRRILHSWRVYERYCKRDLSNRKEYSFYIDGPPPGPLLYCTHPSLMKHVLYVCKVHILRRPNYYCNQVKIRLKSTDSSQMINMTIYLYILIYVCHLCDFGSEGENTELARNKLKIK